MNDTILGLIAVSAMLVPNSPQAQPKPSLAGKWTLVPGTTRDGGTGGCPGIFGAQGLGQEFTATQTSAVLTIERLQGPPANQALTRFIYKLDGSDSTNTVPLGGKAISKASWSGQKLSIATTS